MKNSILILEALLFLTMMSPLSRGSSPSPLTVASAESSILVSTLKYDITAPANSNFDVKQLQSVLDGAIDQFETKITPLKSKILISLEPQGCLRVGYNFSKGDVEFCAVKNVIHDGLDSTDVIRHEAFHAMVCNVRPDICSSSALSSTAVVATHEALADFFAYQFEKDDCFGENFYTDQQCVRHYLSDFCYSLVSGVHEKGNALESQLISASISLEKMRLAILQSTFLPADILQSAELSPDSCFDQENAPQIANSVTNYPASSLNKYWISPTLPLILQFNPNPAMGSRYQNISMQWMKEDGTSSSKFDITSTGNLLEFTLQPSASTGIEKLIAQIYDGQHLIGDIPFYLGIKITP